MSMMSTVPQRKTKPTNFQEHCNSMDHHIKFTIELPGTDGLPFLDILTKPTPDSIKFTVYRKCTFTDRYLAYKCNHLILAKLSVICTLTHRVGKVCSTPELLANEVDQLHKVLQVSHYASQSFQQTKPQQKATRHPNSPTEKFIEGTWIIIPYIKCLIEQYRYILTKHKVRIVFKAPGL